MDMWFLVKPKLRQERRAAENLERQGVVSFLWSASHHE